MSKNNIDYDSTVNYLYSLQKYGIKLGLANTMELMRLLGEPHKAFHSLHIAGTNGKGSTATALASILTESKFKVGLFTSPHLVSFTERIRINSRQISETDVIGMAAEIRELMRYTDLNPTFFEFVTAMAFHYFAINKVDWAVIETGMGGRLDATNVLQPEISIITNISHDHQEFLGDSISEITCEKAGIIKPGVPLITGTNMPDVVRELSEITDSIKAELHVYNSDFKATLISMDDKVIKFNYSGFNKFINLSMPLSGEYQINNASLAVRACELLQKKGFLINDNSIIRGLSGIKLEGRLEWISDDPPIIVDSAHNPEAAAALASSAKMLFHDKNIILVLGVLDDKDIKEISKPFTEIARTVILTKAKYERAASPDKLRKIFEDLQDKSGSITVLPTDSVPEALALAIRKRENNDIILVTGSFYTTGEVKELLGGAGVLSTLRESFGNPSH